MKLICMLWLYLLINSSNGQKTANESSATNESDPISATWHDFQTRHIVGSNPGTAANWNNFFRQRLPSQYGKKSVNTFIVSAASTISKNFPLGVPQYTGGSASNLYWSSTKQHIFVLTLSGKPTRTYYVYYCGQKYYVAGLDMATRLPVHYQGHSSTQGPRIDPIIAHCTPVMCNGFLCELRESIKKEDLKYIYVSLTGTLLVLVIVAFLVATVFFKKMRGGGNNAMTDEYSPLVDNDGQYYGRQCTLKN